MSGKKRQRLLPLVLLLTMGFAFLHSTAWAQEAATPTYIPVEFTGTVESVGTDVAVVDQLPVNITTATASDPLQPGQVVSIIGSMQPDGSIVAETIEVLQMNVSAPTLLAQAPASAETVNAAPQSIPCALAPGDWMSTPDQWPATALRLGGQDYSQAELASLLNAEPSADASLTLARELVAAHFNILNGIDAGEYYGLLYQADALLVRRGEFQYKLPYGVAPASSGGQQMLNTANLLSAFNVSQNAAGCQAPSAAPENLPSIIVEGTVDAVTQDGLAVNGLNIILDHSNPSLATVQTGEQVRIEGVLVGQNGADIRVMPVNVRIERNTPAQAVPAAQSISDAPQPASPPQAVNPPPPAPPPENVSPPQNPPPPANPPGNGDSGMGDEGMGNDDDDDDDDKGMGMGDD